MNLSKYQRKLTLFGILRDSIINAIPFKILPECLIKSLYGGRINFIFLVHPRHKNDIYGTVPFLKFIKKIIPEGLLFKMLTISPVYMVARAELPGLRGLVISTSIMPEDLFSKREETGLALSKIVNFIRKIAYDRIYVGLAAWWPIVTNSGLAFKRVLKEDDKIVITNGHAATLLSIYLTVNKICEISSLKLENLRLLIIGLGKMGSAVTEILNGKVKDMGIIDRNAIRAETLENHLLKKTPHSLIKRYVATEAFLSGEMISILSKYDIAVCTTSNINYIVRDASSLKNCIVIDDSRPEAFPRIIDSKNNVIVMEGGLIKFNDLELDADFGFGKKDNVFGCMAEAIILALDDMRTLEPTIGEIDYDNFSRMLTYCKEHNITEGDFKSGQHIVKPELLRNIVKNKLQTASENIE